MEMTNYLEEKIAEHVLGGASYSQPTSWEVGLFTDTANLEQGSTTNEVGQPQYSRVEVTNWKDDSGPTDGVKLNDGLIQFNEADNDWGTIKAIAIFDKGANEMLYYDDDVNQVTVNAQQRYEIGDGDLKIQHK